MHSRGCRNMYGAGEVRGICGAQDVELNMEQRQQERRKRGRRAVSDEAQLQQQLRGLWEASLLPVAITVLRALAL